MKKLAKQLMVDVKELAALKGKKVSEAEAMSLAIKAVEAYSGVENLDSAGKKELAVAIVKEIAKSQVGKKYGAIISMVVGLLNAIFGKDWFSKAE